MQILDSEASYMEKSFSKGGLVALLAAQRERWRARTPTPTELAAFKDLFALAPIPILMLHGLDLTVEIANEAALNILGNDNVLGRTLLDVLPEIAGQGCARVLREVMGTGVPHIREEAFVGLDERRPPFHGTSYWTFTCSRWKGEDSEHPRVIVVFADVTAQVVARKGLEGLAEKAEAANRAKDQFFAMLSHELRNPLSPIVTALELMRLNGFNTREQALIERQVGHLVRLVDDLLDVSRIARGQVTLKRRPMDLGEVVAAAVEIVSPLLEERRHRLVVDVPEGLHVDVDPDRMSQVVSNLLTNAAKYSPENSRISITSAAAGDKVRLAVADEGIGIDSDRLGKIFDAFSQHAQASERSSGGLGLGLTIVWNLVQLHGGEVHAYSGGHGKGSEFIVELPRSSAVSQAQPVFEATASVQSSQRKVLVIDDNRDAADTLAAALTSIGYEARVAHDGPSALSLAQHFSPETALVDIGLPVMDGYELARRLRERAGGIRLIAITGYGQAEDRRRSKEAGFERHLVKPVALDEIRSALDEVDSP